MPLCLNSNPVQSATQFNGGGGSALVLRNTRIPPLPPYSNGQNIILSTSYPSNIHEAYQSQINSQFLVTHPRIELWTPPWPPWCHHCKHITFCSASASRLVLTNTATLDDDSWHESSALQRRWNRCLTLVTSAIYKINNKLYKIWHIKMTSTILEYLIAKLFTLKK